MCIKLDKNTFKKWTKRKMRTMRGSENFRDKKEGGEREQKIRWGLMCSVVMCSSLLQRNVVEEQRDDKFFDKFFFIFFLLYFFQKWFFLQQMHHVRMQLFVCTHLLMCICYAVYEYADNDGLTIDDDHKDDVRTDGERGSEHSHVRYESCTAKLQNHYTHRGPGIANAIRKKWS